MEVCLRDDCAGVDWAAVSETLRRVGMAHYAPDIHQRAFEASHTTVFAYYEGQMVGFGRAISDGTYQAAVYDLAVVPEFQGRGIGKAIMQNILARLSGCNVILYAVPDKEDFYRSLGLRRMYTGMALFQHPAAMAAKGFTE